MKQLKSVSLILKVRATFQVGDDLRNLGEWLRDVTSRGDVLEKQIEVDLVDDGGPQSGGRKNP